MTATNGRAHASTSEPSFFCEDVDYADVAEQDSIEAVCERAREMRARGKFGSAREMRAHLTKALKLEVAGSGTPSRAPLYRRARDVVEDIIQRQDEPQWPLTLAGEALADIAAGEIVVLLAAAKRGKTSLAVCLLREHARERGPAIVVSLELRARVLVARTIGTSCATSWRGVLRGEVPRERMHQVLPERLMVIERDDASIASIESTIDAVRREYPCEPILVGVDYVQLLPSSAHDQRARVDDAMRQIDRVAQSRSVGILALSQSSRAASRELASGERLGAAAADAGAESAAIERWASAVIAIGKIGEPAEDGTALAELSIAAQRYDLGDRVLPARYDGRSGLWRIVGDARPAAEVKAERAAERDTRTSKRLMLAIAALLAQADAPMSRREIREAIGGRDTAVRSAVSALLADPASDVVEVGPPVRSAWPVWTRDRAEAAGGSVRDHHA